MSMDLALLRGFLAGHPLAVTPLMADTIARVIERRSAGIRLAPEELSVYRRNAEHLNSTPNGVVTIADFSADESFVGVSAYDAANLAAAAANGGASGRGAYVAVINIVGIMGQHSYQVEDISGPRGTSADRVANAIKQAAADQNIGAILLRIDSPGGSVFGVENLGDTIFSVRGKKPIVAQADSVAASAAYWVGTQADELVITPGGMVGSIGVLSMHEDVSRLDEAIGVKYTYIHAGERKVWGNPHEPLHDEARASVQQSVDHYYDKFLEAVARGRGVSVATARKDFGRGETVLAETAVKLGMANRVASLDDTLSRLTKQVRGGRSTSAETAEQTPAADDTEKSEGPTAEELAAREQDGFRRRRHAMRMHQAGLRST